ncbi:MAG: hypothetical protein HY721_30475 [Planctomycetes bacterium]|nr:hypothetical protein [Planctomycetota bacterium]
MRGGIPVTFAVLAGLAVFAGAAGPAGAADRFVRGDADGSGALAITDAIRVLQHIFLGRPEAVACRDAADADDSGSLEVTDSVAVLGYLFLRGPAPPAPFPRCGPDPTEDALDCGSYEGCGSAFTLFGLPFEARGAFFVIDRSGSMMDSGELALAKKGVVEAIQAFPESMVFGIVFADSNVAKFPASGQPAEATESMRAAAVAFVQSVGGGSGSCDRPALLTALQFAKLSRSRDDAVLYLTDGGGTCQGADEAQYLNQTLKDVTAANQGIARIHSLQIGQTGARNANYLRDLAEQNGGEYHVVPLR